MCLILGVTVSSIKFKVFCLLACLLFYILLQKVLKL